MSELKKEKFDQPHEFDQYLGQIDMEHHPLWEEAWVGQNKEKFEKILHDMGADLAYGYEFRVCLYRARTNNKVEYGVRVSFVERTDKWWISNMMSTSDIVRNTKNSIRATGMRESLMEESPMHLAMTAAAERFVVNADIVVNENDIAILVEGVK